MFRSFGRSWFDFTEGDARYDLGVASLVEPLAVVLHGLRRARLRGGERLAVVGGGNIGLCAVAAARAAGAHVALEARATQPRWRLSGK